MPRLLLMRCAMCCVLGALLMMQGVAQTRNYTMSTIGKHDDEVLGVFVNQANTRFATCSVDETIKIWSLPDGKELRTLSGHLGQVNNVSFSGDDKSLASASSDNTVRVWDVETGKQIAVLRGHNAEVSSVYYSQLDSGAYICSGSFDRTVKLWDTHLICHEDDKCTLGEVKTLRGHTAAVNGVAYSYDGKYIASCGDDYRINVWSSEIGKKDPVINLSGPGHQAPILNCLFSFDNKFLVSADKDGVIKVWKMYSGELVRTINAHEDLVQDFTFTEDNQTLISVSLDKTVKMWNILSGEKLFEMKLDTEIWGVDVTSDGKTIILACADGTVRVLRDSNMKAGTTPTPKAPKNHK